MTDAFHGQRLLVRTGGVVLATPLLAVLVLVEVTDLVFAVDSIPAIFAVTDEAFLVFTANAFALLGLRALYFLLADLIHRFVHLKTGLALVMLWVGVKMLLKIDLYAIPTVVSLGVIATILTSAVVASLVATRGQARRTPPRRPSRRSASRPSRRWRASSRCSPPVQGPAVSRSTVTHERTGGASPWPDATAPPPPASHTSRVSTYRRKTASPWTASPSGRTPPGEHALRPSRERELDGHAREAEVAEPRPSRVRAISAPRPQCSGRSTRARSGTPSSAWKPPTPASTPSTSTAHGPYPSARHCASFSRPSGARPLPRRSPRAACGARSAVR